MAFDFTWGSDANLTQVLIENWYGQGSWFRTDGSFIVHGSCPYASADAY